MSPANGLRLEDGVWTMTDAEFKAELAKERAKAFEEAAKAVEGIVVHHTLCGRGLFLDTSRSDVLKIIRALAEREEPQ